MGVATGAAMRSRHLHSTLPCAALLALLSVRCGGGDPGGGSNATGDDGGGTSSGASSGSGGGSGSGASSGSSGGASGGGGDDGGPDAWMAPDVGTPVDAGDPGPVDITFEVQANQNVHAISPYVYGVNNGGQAAAVHSPIVRTGGNRMTAYDWENNASNAENDDFLCSTIHCAPTNDTPGAFLEAVVDQAHAAGAAALVTVPIVDYVSADKSPGGDVRSSGSSYLQTRFKQNEATKGAAFVYPPDTSDAYVYQDEMVSWLEGAESSTPLLFQLDNEPDLWSGTHAEVHPAAVTYAELAQRNVEYAKAIKAVAPSAHVIGPVNYGWEGYVTLQSASDAQADGDFLSWWLDQMKAAEQATGKRLVDGLDLHWYPEATGDGHRITDTGTSAGEVAAREQAPRSLWDATYVESSWITQSMNDAAIQLIPRVMQKIAQHYPGTKLSISEWNYGAGNDISGAIASADVLGIFGAYAVDMAMMWELSNESYTYAAFDAYRNYDGQGAAFGDTSVETTTTDVADGTAYASLQSTDASKLVIVAINKATASKVAGIRIAHSTVYTKASVYTITAGGGAKVVAASGITSVATNAFRYTMPEQSISVIVPTP
jgi:hypothetical protein